MRVVSLSQHQNCLVRTQLEFAPVSFQRTVSLARKACQTKERNVVRIGEEIASICSQQHVFKTKYLCEILADDTDDLSTTKEIFDEIGLERFSKNDAYIVKEVGRIVQPPCAHTTRAGLPSNHRSFGALYGSGDSMRRQQTGQERCSGWHRGQTKCLRISCAVP